MTNITIGLLIPFVGTVLGAAMVYLLKDEISPRLQKLLLGFASGVMVAASVWSLLLPSLEMAKDQDISATWLPASVGFLAGMGFLLLLDSVIPHLHINSDEPEGVKTKLKKNTMLVFAVTLHNIPEGMAVGVVLAGMMEGVSNISFASAMALSVGIAIQNFPEGAIISMPLKSAGRSRRKAFISGALSGIVEPIAGIITILLISVTLPILPYLLAFAAGAMIYVVVEELIPEAQTGTHSNIATIGVAIGFVLMMILDVALG
ncbi:MAG: ZIP family metal transporter [Tannerella sp.]|jgi:ZIP family zinc transporter|nr:ZIP family metal transporter [Tannerella sp.]